MLPPDIEMEGVQHVPEAIHGGPLPLTTGSEPSGPVRLLPRVWSDRSAPVPLVIGVTYEAWHPFKLGEYTSPIDEGPESGGTFCMPRPAPTWVPGFRFAHSGPEDLEEAWDGEGVQMRTVVSLHKPGPTYPERVFYTRQWRGPNGRVFGKGGLRCVVAPTFRHWLRGERWPAYTPARRAHIAWVEAAGQQP